METRFLPCFLRFKCRWFQSGQIYTGDYKFDVWLTVHRSSMWNKKPTRCHLILHLFLLYKLLFISCSTCFGPPYNTKWHLVGFLFHIILESFSLQVQISFPESKMNKFHRNLQYQYMTVLSLSSGVHLTARPRSCSETAQHSYNS